jgi:riboflavin kinase/FMN adenylyltransferase
MTQEKFSGIVVEGKKRGKALGFPTANLDLQKEILDSLEEGVYVSKVWLRGEVFQGVTHIGSVETFDEKKKMVETHILDFDRDIYGQILKINLLKKIRKPKKFDNVEKLKERITKDVLFAREFLN